MPAAAIVNFEDENGEEDGDRALQDATCSLSNLEWEDDDIPFFFNQAEIKMKSVGVKKSFTKFQVLATIIRKKVIKEVKPFLRLQESEFTNNDSYKRLKKNILRIFGPKPEVAMNRALSRVLTGTPSSLARELVQDVCKHQMSCDCCPGIIAALYTAIKAQVDSPVLGWDFVRGQLFQIMSAKIANFCYNVRGRFCQDTVQAERVQQMKKDRRKYVPMQYLNLETTNENGSV